MLTLYRAICHDKDPRQTVGLGKHWSLSPAAAFPCGSKKWTQLWYWLYTAEVHPYWRNILQTQIANQNWPWDKEVVLDGNAPVKIIAIQKFKMPCQTLIETLPIEPYQAHT